MSEFTFYKNLDSSDFDIVYVGNKNVNELITLCKQNKRCVGFNTLGFLKYYIKDEKQFCTSPYFSIDDGLYVHNKRYNKIKNKMYIGFNDYVFYPNKDSVGNNVNVILNNSILELKNIADNNDDCIAFNTTGYFKNYITPKSQFKNINSPLSYDGLYVKKYFIELINCNINNICFIHSCNINGIDILLDMLNVICKSGLLNVLDYVYIINIGIPIDYEKIRADKIKLINYSENIKLCEKPTLNIMNMFSKCNEKVKILYLHTKGVTNPKSIKIIDWRNYMMYFLVEKYESCLELLDDYNCIGCNYQEKPYPHFSGNFWWSKSSYINTLNKITSDDRHDCEWWILNKNNDVNKFVLHNTNINHYNQTYPRELYDNKKTNILL